MSIKGFAKQRDRNEKDIVDVLERVGASVTRMSDRGVPDLLVGFRGATHLFEVKMPLGPKGGSSGRSLTEDQESWWREWRGGQLVIVRSPEEALAALGLRIGPPGITTWCQTHKDNCQGDLCDSKDTHVVDTYPRITPSSPRGPRRKK